MKVSRASIAIAAILVAAGASWFGLSQYRTHAACNERGAAFLRQVESIKRDAHERLKIGTTRDELSKFFIEHGILLTIVGSEATGTLQTSGRAHLLAVAQIRVK
jgi:hypothetical protein